MDAREDSGLSQASTFASGDSSPAMCFPPPTDDIAETQAKTATALVSAARARSALLDTIYNVKPSAFAMKKVKEFLKAAASQNTQCHAEPDGVKTQSAAEDITAVLARKMSASSTPVHTPQASRDNQSQSHRISQATQQLSEITSATLSSHKPLAAPNATGCPLVVGGARLCFVQRMRPLTAREPEPRCMRTPRLFLTPRTRLRLRSLANQRGSNANLSLILSTSSVTSWHNLECDYNPLRSMMSSWSARHKSSLSWRDPEYWTDDAMVDNAFFTDDHNRFDYSSSSPVDVGGVYYAAGLMMMGPLGDVLAQRIERTFAEIERCFALLEIKSQISEPHLESPTLAPPLSSLNSPVDTKLPAMSVSNSSPTTLPSIVWQASEFSVECLLWRARRHNAFRGNKLNLPKSESPLNLNLDLY